MLDMSILHLSPDDLLDELASHVGGHLAVHQRHGAGQGLLVPVTSHVLQVTCHVSRVMCHVLRVIPVAGLQHASAVTAQAAGVVPSEVSV